MFLDLDEALRAVAIPELDYQVRRVRETQDQESGA
jgi:hypothetical protein